MTRICLWCLSEWDAPEPGAGPVASSTCRSCRQALFAPGATLSLGAYLDRLGAPVLVLRDDLRVTGMNQQAALLLGKSAAGCVGQLGGEVTECAYARLPGGCGQTTHCQACTIRQTVSFTQATGQARHRVLAYQDMITSAGPRQRLFRVSTEKIGPFVLLKIEPEREADAAID